MRHWIFYFNRLAARVFTLDPDGWLIKGGQALLVRYRGAARLSGDIDLQTAQPGLTPNEARPRILEAAAHDLGDFLRFASGKYTAAADPDRGGSQYFQVYLGPSRVDGVKVDIAVRRTLVGTPETSPLLSAVDLPWPVDWQALDVRPVGGLTGSGSARGPRGQPWHARPRLHGDAVVQRHRTPGVTATGAKPVAPPDGLGRLPGAPAKHRGLGRSTSERRLVPALS
ncbi:nucleotidyl transferase AbiEii/AbiGii toxin family protein [Streptomyces sp. SLBN-31]|uniref:nucleotidyl transferase AbiEii/AbiGii toxin family protein n=1 Tax=Streptomyces sp. SLBN-31 TaxID=2768444 RepID=UPI001151FE42|nr:nucleotidyl transferase AbiEii/AbiGii toxin family protein [Streptomyces sp. SLBN-31]TQJ92965.1 nucleotidyltransferase AbiEii toxin of type IV toxin-antitoxin system [Streptomyces sp. SLBN-31]